MKKIKLSSSGLLLLIILFCATNVTAQVIEKTDHADNQTYDELPIVKPDFMVSSLSGDYGADQSNSNIAIDSSGNYAVTWIDARNGKNEIYAQFFNNKDIKAGNNIKVSEGMGNWNNSPSIAVNKSGNFIIAWAQNEYQILAQRFSKNGEKTGGIIQLNNQYGNTLNEPSLAVNDDGSFLAMWPSAAGYIYARLFNSSGNPSTHEFVVNSFLGYSSSRENNRVAVDGKGNYIVVWNSNAGNSTSKIFLQNINNIGNMVDANVAVSDLNDSRNHYSPSISATDDGHFLITWNISNSYPSPNATLGRIYHSDGYFVSEQKNLYDSGSPCLISSDRKNSFLISYTLQKRSFREISKTGEFIGQPAVIDSLYGIYTNISNFYEEHFYISLTRNQKNDPDIFLQKYDAGSLSPGFLLKVNDDIFSSFQMEPVNCSNKQGSSIIIWRDQRNGMHDLYAQIYDKSFNPVGDNFQINEDSYKALLNKTVHSLSDGTFVIAFICADIVGREYVILQLVSTNGERIGSNKLVKEEYFQYPGKILLGINDKDEILICWYDDDKAYLRKYDRDLSSVQSEKNFIKYTSNGRYDLTISIDDELNLLATWLNNAELASNRKVYGLNYDETGTVVSDTMIIPVPFYVYSFANSLDGKDNNIITWIHSGGLYIQRNYYSDKLYSFTTELGINNYPYYVHPQIIRFKNRKGFVAWNNGLSIDAFFFNDNKRQAEYYKLGQLETLGNNFVSYSTAYDADIFEDLLLLSYESQRNGETGYDIWAKVQQVDNVNFKNEIFFPPADDDVLHTNYPNPFNARTRIVYELFSFHKVKLTIYDLLGREIKVIVDQYQEKGVYEIDFDASDLSSGVYFYKLDAFKTIMKKMILIK